MRICINGNVKSAFIKEFIKRISSFFNDSSFELITPVSSADFKLKNLKEFVYTYNTSFVEKFPRVRKALSIYKKNKIIKSLKRVDLYHIHYLDDYTSYVSKTINKKSKSVITSIWGSDFYRADHKLRNLQKRIYDISERITFANKKTLDKFDEYYKLKYSDKLRICRFGLSTLDEQKKLKMNKDECRNFFRLPRNSKIVTVGYNNDPGQQHIKIIQSISNVSNKLPENIFFLFPMTYGGTDEYREKVRKEMEKLGLKYKIFSDYLSFREMAIISKASDIMIQLQITDQFSGTMQEFLYANNIVITGEWLPYDIFYENGVFMLKTSEVEKAGERLLYAIDNFDELENKTGNNSSIIWELSSWEKNIESWVDLYREALNTKDNK